MIISDGVEYSLPSGTTVGADGNLARVVDARVGFGVVVTVTVSSNSDGNVYFTGAGACVVVAG